MPLSARPPPFSLCAAHTAQRTIAEEGIPSVKTEQSTFAHYDLRKDEQRHAAGYRCEANAKSLTFAVLPLAVVAGMVPSRASPAALFCTTAIFGNPLQRCRTGRGFL